MDALQRHLKETSSPENRNLLLLEEAKRMLEVLNLGKQVSGKYKAPSYEPELESARDQLAKLLQLDESKDPGRILLDQHLRYIHELVRKQQHIKYRK